MSLTNPAPEWFLFDYGMVISEAPSKDDWALLKQVAGLDLEPRNSSYWQYRLDFDAGRLDSAAYWRTVLGRLVSPELVDQLDGLDAAQWSHLNTATLTALGTLQSRNRRLALLSNMPVRMSEKYRAESTWTKYFSKLFFSGTLRMIKPEQQIFDHVLRELGARPEQVLFIDDNHSNIRAAHDLGLQTLQYQPQIDLMSRLALEPS